MEQIKFLCITIPYGFPQLDEIYFSQKHKVLVINLFHCNHIFGTMLGKYITSNKKQIVM